ncbi:metallophosphoesterase family protein [Bacillus thuringiensis]|uniref:metallophosphoesterase family protein n=1 Tax=Bacillus thuringiensis TaxID=1428 RepID=UPI000BFA5D2D|nr:metallophosphoesterase [Bacillus thuringiensis]PET17061.1 hypothetical protein CN517_21260 [Bacillus thuringiensis]
MKQNDVVNLLHISDIHFGADYNSETLNALRKNALNRLVKTLSELPKAEKPDIVVISGDITWQGKQDGYILAKEWINELLETLELTTNELIVCAGNHDINREEAFAVKPPSSSKEADEWLTTEKIQYFINHFPRFDEFCNDLKIPPLSLGEKKYNLVGYRDLLGLRFIVLNSSWFCRGEEDRNNLWIGLPLLRLMEANSQLIDTDDYDNEIISVGAIHHPYNWLNEEEISTYGDRPATYRYLAERSHLILSGHVHGTIDEPTRMYNRGYLILGGATYAGGNYRNNFSILKINKENRSVIQTPFEYDPRYSKWEKRGAKEFSLRTKFEEKKN